MRYSDTKSAGRSDIAPYKSWEGHARRHNRRLNENLDFRGVLEAWCAQHGMTLKVSNEGHHWRIEGARLLAEWWPSSAKLVFNKHWEHGIHCHDVEQLATLVGKRIQ